MATEQDATEFVDESYQPGEHPAEAGLSEWSSPDDAAPSLNQVESQVAEKQRRLAELRQAQEQLERERATLEELRRRQTEFKTGREEMIKNLVRGIGLLEESELSARRDAELAAKTVADFKVALDKVNAITEENWTKEQLNVELTRALTAIENARMEWNSARVKLPVLSGETPVEKPAKFPNSPAAGSLPFSGLNFWQLCKLGLAFTWPLLVVSLAALGVFIMLLGMRH